MEQQNWNQESPSLRVPLSSNARRAQNSAESLYSRICLFAQLHAVARYCCVRAACVPRSTADCSCIRVRSSLFSLPGLPPFAFLLTFRAIARGSPRLRGSPQQLQWPRRLHEQPLPRGAHAAMDVIPGQPRRASRLPTAKGIYARRVTRDAFINALKSHQRLLVHHINSTTSEVSVMQSCGPFMGRRMARS